MPLKKFRRGKEAFPSSQGWSQNKEILIPSHVLLLYAYDVQTQVAGSPNNDRILAFTETGVSWRVK